MKNFPVVVLVAKKRFTFEFQQFSNPYGGFSTFLFSHFELLLLLLRPQFCKYTSKPLASGTFFPSKTHQISHMCTHTRTQNFVRDELLKIYLLPARLSAFLLCSQANPKFPFILAPFLDRRALVCVLQLIETCPKALESNSSPPSPHLLCVRVLKRRISFCQHDVKEARLVWFEI